MKASYQSDMGLFVNIVLNEIVGTGQQLKFFEFKS